MKKHLDEKEWLEEFNAFISASNAEVPADVSEQILVKTRKALNPSPWLIFAKLLGIHSIVGTLSLGICSQFGLNPFNTTLSLAEYFMTFGHSVCMTLCGVIFIGLSVLGTLLLFNRDETNVFKKNFVFQVLSLGLLSLAAFVAFGAHLTLGIAALWLLGGFVGGALPTWALAPKAAGSH